MHGYSLTASGPADGMKRHDSQTSYLIAVDQPPVIPEGKEIYRVLLRATNAGVYSADLLLDYTPTNRVVEAVQAGSDTGAALISNTNVPGTIRVGLASAKALTFDGPLVLVRFSGAEPVSLSIIQVSLNEGLLSAPQLASAAAFDRDGDGLIDYDELNVFHTDPTNPDTDGDGMADGAEVRAGTNPLDRLSVFAVRACTVAGNGSRQITWSAVPGRRYQLEHCDGLTDPAWKAAGPVVTADQETCSGWDDSTVGGTSRLYRVRLVQ